MKKIFKLSLSLLGNQILACVGAAMCIIFVNLLLGDTIPGHLLFIAINMSFFVYIEYRAAFTYGFHDVSRREKPQSKAFIFKGLAAGAISAIPLIIIICLFVYSRSNWTLPWTNLFMFMLRIFATYYIFPMLNLFPNHILAVIFTSVIAPLVVPMLGYIAGYKNFEWTRSILNIKYKNPEEKSKQATNIFIRIIRGIFKKF